MAEEANNEDRRDGDRRTTDRRDGLAEAEIAGAALAKSERRRDIITNSVICLGLTGILGAMALLLMSASMQLA